MKRLPVVLVAVFVVMVGYGIALTVLPYYAERVHGLATVDQRTLALHIGLLTSVYALAQLIASPLLGRIVDAAGRRPVLLAGLVGMAITQTLFGLVPRLWVLYGSRVAGGVATAALIVASTAYVADLTSETDRPRGMAWYGTAVSLGLVAGPALGGLLSRPGVRVGTGDVRLDGYSVPFVTAGALAFAMFCVAWRFLPESRAPASYPAQVPSTEGSRSRGGLGLRPLLALVVASEFGLALFEGTFVIFAKDRLAIGPTRAAVAFMVCGLVMAVFQVVAVSVFARFVSSIVQVALGLALMGGGIAWLIAIHSFGVALGAIAVLAFGTALVIPNLSALVSAHRGARTGSALGLKNAASSLGQFGGPFVGGVLVGWREDSPFAIASIGLLAAALVVGVVSANRATWDDDRDNAPTAVG